MGKGIVCFSEDYLKDQLLCYYGFAIDDGDSFMFNCLCDAISVLYCTFIVSADLYDFSVELDRRLRDLRMQSSREELETLLRELN